MRRGDKWKGDENRREERGEARWEETGEERGEERGSAKKMVSIESSK